MTKLVWGAAGERTFEAGVDRGVLYVPGLAGVPWNGLKSVSEAPDGGDPQPFYLDGIKYANISSEEDFAASLAAFSSPKEFAVCDGSKQLAAGLYATQQPRQSFGLSYRTRVGNDILGIDSGYKIHLVYNALASAAGRANNTTTGSIDPTDLSWDITTRPPIVAGYRPTAHLVIHTKDVNPTKLALLETALYGDLTTVPGLPTQAAVAALLT